ncbi:MAG: DUF1501 domain-containing protein [Saprospiraceae bacterium]|nr:DUF1501 domain-containing protein [Saprospiraceae bacterium]
MTKYHINRRKFIGQASCMAVGGTTFLSSLLNLKAMNAMSISNSSVLACNDYKALVCLFNSGGLDAFNMLLPTTSSEYNTYAATRSNQSIPLADILPINTLNTPGRTFGLHPSMNNMQSLFNSGDIAFISNIGALVAPMTKQEYYDEAVTAPLGLFSHSDQQMHWQTGFAHARAAAGWGGRIADLLTSCNTNPNISMAMSLSGTNLFETGNNSVEFTLSPYGPVGINDDNDSWWYNTLRKTNITNMLDATYMNVFEQTYKNTTKSARVGNAQISTALTNAPSFNGIFSGTYLSDSFKMVAKIIASQASLGMNRQIFFIDYGGWDHHDNLLQNQQVMLNEVDNAIGEFHTALSSINKLSAVTTFSLSEFSRTLTSNGNGTDHAWGSNVFVMGGAVNGQKIYGEYPTLQLNGPLEVGGGVLIPTTAAEEYFSEIAMWFGVPNSNLLDLYPNLGNFYSIGNGNPIGFLNI